MRHFTLINVVNSINMSLIRGVVSYLHHVLLMSFKYVFQNLKQFG